MENIIQVVLIGKDMKDVWVKQQIQDFLLFMTE